MWSRLSFSGGDNHATSVAPISFFFKGGHALSKKRRDNEQSVFKASMFDLGHVIFEITGQTPDEICDEFYAAIRRKYQCDGRKRRGR